MNRDQLRDMLNRVRGGTLEVEEAIEQLRLLPYEDIGFAKIDHHRSIRRGFPEVVLGQGKTVEQVARIVERLAAAADTVLVTKASPEAFVAVEKAVPGACYHPLPRLIVVGGPAGAPVDCLVLVVAAGTADVPVAEEAVITAETMGSRVERIYDVGVAGLHRLMAYKERLFEADVIVAVAGMEGALPSIVAGMVDSVVVAVPTSVGYGASFQGLAALLGMLNTCAPGVAVVNIDNGFGAGYLASMIGRRRGGKR